MDRDQELNSLYDDLLKELRKKIKSGEAKPADFECARKFLADNGIDAAPKAKPGLVDLSSLMPDGAFAGPDDTLQ